MHRIAVTLAALAFTLAQPALAADPPQPQVDRAPSGEAMAFDLFVMRPLSLVGTIAGAAIFVVSIPFDLVAWNLSDPARRLVGEPAAFTFTRPLGDLD